MTVPQPIPTGAVRFNTDSGNMEVYIGDTWMEVAVSSPNLDGGARGLIMGGYSPGSGDGESRVNVIESVVISTSGNSVDFGDLTVARYNSASMASRTRLVVGGGQTPTLKNEIDYKQFASTGNFSDFGNLETALSQLAGCSNGHGGL